MTQQKFRLDIPKKFGPSERKAIAKDVIEFVKTRSSRDGKDKFNRRFPIYSKEYASSKGVSRSNVDLILSGEMINKLGEYTRDRSGSITIGYNAGDANLNGKIEGNIKGTYGQSKSTGKRRDFLGITKKDLKEIIKNVG